MPSYRTEVDVPPDRYVWLKLPDHFPLGRATVTVAAGDSAEPPSQPPDEPERDDIEWWEEFDAGPGQGG